jgi:hypothetical protein
MRYGYYGSGITFSQGVEKGSLAEVDDSMALGLLSRRESRKDLWVRLRLNDTTTLYCTNIHSSNAARPLKMLVFDTTRISPLFWHFCSPDHIYSLPLIMLHM